MRVKKRRKIKILYIIVSAILLLYAFSMLLPMYYLVINSLKDTLLLYKDAWGFPKPFQWSNYAQLKDLGMMDGGNGQASLVTMYLNSTILTVSGTLIAAAATTVTAYTVARFDFRGKNLIVSIGIGAMLIPDLGSRAVVYKLYCDLNMIDTWFILIQYGTPFGIMFLITYSLFKTVSKTYAEAAKMDGASELRIFIQIMIPMAKGVIGMMLVMSAIGLWNDYYTPYMYLPHVKTLALGVQELAEEAQAGNVERTVLYAAMVISVLPIVILFITMRDTIINNAVAGGLKG